MCDDFTCIKRNKCIGDCDECEDRGYFQCDLCRWEIERDKDRIEEDKKDV